MSSWLPVMLLGLATYQSDFDSVSTRLPATLNPTVPSSTRYVSSRKGLCMRLNSPATLDAPFSPERGTIEMWVRVANASTSQTFLEWGGGGGLALVRDGAKNTRLILNRFSPVGYPEQGVGIDTSDWTSGRWQHIAVSWTPTQIVLSVNGKVEKQKINSALFPITDSRMSVGGPGVDLDDFKISTEASSELVIRRSFWNSARLASLGLTTTRPSVMGWRCNLKLEVLAEGIRRSVPFDTPVWSTTTPTIIRINPTTGPYSINAGAARVTAALGTLTSSLGFMVQRPLIAPTNETLTADMTTPAPNAVWDYPIAVAVFLPTQDRVNLDAGLTDWTSSLVNIRDRVLRMARLHKMMLQEASRFRGYKDPLARPSLGTRIVRYVVFFEDIPRGIQAGSNPVAYFPDYGQIVERLGGRSLIETQGVKEVHVWHWHHGEVVPVESNMSSPTTGDISNSFRHNDLPVYNRTYTVFGFNYTRSANLHNHGHQWESILDFVCNRQDGNTNLFARDFVGIVNGSFQKGRVGGCHHPPNADFDYDYSNSTPALSDCEDWRPDGLGTKKLVQDTTWEGINYPFPPADRLFVPGSVLDGDAHYYIYWNQNFPGLDNTIPMVGGGTMNNWWRFLGDYDNAIRENYGLYRR